MINDGMKVEKIYKNKRGLVEMSMDDDDDTLFLA
jgi:hypothetical protein